MVATSASDSPTASVSARSWIGAAAAVAIVALALLAPDRGHAAPGDLDPDFGGTGIVTVPFTSNTDRAAGLAIQPDGKVLAVGSMYNGSDFDFAVARLHPDGSLDTSFDGDGKVNINVNGTEEGRGIAVQPDGKIVVVGESFAVASTPDVTLVRLNPDGSLDTSFDADGKVTTPVAGSTEFGYAVAIRPDGKIVVAGVAVFSASEQDFLVLRYNGDGSLDTSFDGDGIVTTAFGSGIERAAAVALQPDGKIVVAGGDDGDVAVARYLDDGSLDASFDGDGKTTVPIGSGDDAGKAVVLQPDGKIVVAGYAFAGSGSDYDPALVRLDADGTLDAAFDADGTLTTDFGPGTDAYNGVALQGDQKIVAVGSVHNGSNFDIGIARYRSDGSLDPYFDADGKATTPIGFTDTPNDVEVQPDGRIVLTGHSDFDFVFVRYLSALCPSAPEPCIAASRAKLDVNETKPGKEKLKLQLKSIGMSTTPGDFGDPVAGETVVAACLYDQDGVLLADVEVDRAADSCGASPCWKATAKGFAYRDKTASSHGVSKLGFASGDAGKGKADVKAANNAAKGQLALPTGIAAALSGNATPIVQLTTTDGFCAGATLLEVKKDTGTRYTAERK